MTTPQVVFWDIDGTLVSGSLERTFLSYLRRRQLISSSSIPRNFLSLAARLPLPRWYQLKLCYLRGIHIRELNSWAAACWRDELQSRLFADAQSASAHFASLGARQIILSGTLVPLAEQLAAHVGIEDVIAAKPEVVNGVCTGRTAGEHPHGRAKVAQVEEWLAENGRQWSATVAIANHWQDRFLLERSATPVAAHPDEKLRAYAIERGWRIVNELSELRDVFPEAN